MLAFVEDGDVFWGALPPDFEDDVVSGFGLGGVGDFPPAKTFEAVEVGGVVELLEGLVGEHGFAGGGGGGGRSRGER